MTVEKLPTRGLPPQVPASEIIAAPEPTDRQVWAVCPYLRNQERCMGCPAWEEDETFDRIKRGCRALAEEACQVVKAAESEEEAA